MAANSSKARRLNWNHRRLEPVMAVGFAHMEVNTRQRGNLRSPVDLPHYCYAWQVRKWFAPVLPCAA